ncbi:MAG: transcription termination factor NusA [bacterium]|nr:transcription termination factor NusA [bacterium]
MNYEVLEALRQIAQEKNVNRDLVVETLEIGLISAAKKRFGLGDNVEVTFDSGSGSILVEAIKDIVEDDAVEDTGLQMGLSQAKEINPSAEVGTQIREALPFAAFGRNAIQTAKQVLVQRVREAEREKIHEDYQGRIGEIISGTVQQISRGDILINLGRTEAVIPLKEQIRKERYRQGDPIRAYVVNVLRTSKGPQVLLSRTHPGFLDKLFQLEVPEIYEGTIEIKAVAREPGERAKIAVHSNDARIDPVGACVGMKGSRVQAVVRELSNERIDIVPWAEDEAIFLSRALSPAIVKRVVIDRRERRMSAIVEDDQLSLAIGKSGQNARLAAQLTGWHVDIMHETRFEEQQAERAATAVSLADVPGIGKIMYERLEEAGIHSANALVRLPLEKLILVPGIGEATGAKLQQTAKEIVSERIASYREELAIEAARVKAVVDAEKARAAEAAAIAEKAAEEEAAAIAEKAAEEEAAAQAILDEAAAAAQVEAAGEVGEGLLAGEAQVAPEEEVIESTETETEGLEPELLQADESMARMERNDSEA